MTKVDIVHEGTPVRVKIETGDVLVVCNGQWPLARSIKVVTYGRDRRMVAHRAHHTGMMLVTPTTTLVREMDIDVRLKRLGDMWTLWDGAKYNSGNPPDRVLVLMKPVTPYENPEALEKDLMEFRSRYAVRRLFAHVLYRVTGIWGRKRGDGDVCSEMVAGFLNRHKGLFPEPYKVSPRDIMETYPDLFDYYVLNEGK